MVVDLDNVFLPVLNGGTVVVVERVVVGDDGVEIVVAAGELQDYDDWVFLRRGHALNSLLVVGGPHPNPLPLGEGTFSSSPRGRGLR